MDLNNIRPTVKKLFAQFHNNEINKEHLISELYKIEATLKDDDDDKDLWFRFFKGDSIATTIVNLNNDINSRVNHDYILDKIEISVSNPKGFTIFYS